MYEGAGTSGHDSTPTPASTTQSGPTTASGPTTESGPTTPTTGPTTPEPPSSGPEPDPASEPDAAPATLDLTGPALGVVEGFARWLAALAPGTVAGENLGRITALETVKNVCAAAQARETVTFDES
ncbi:MAG: hypothetical protein LPK38_06245, partial [Actinomycetes bacterium]|nr:hypothetical protein [Actinomycetes bacterium]MDX5380886.1 hypothetical protein [Actinomycetes bacterium]MDX5399965.1 hypothetical protein [Actinomycetes bacterium]MDX5450635.1 hypothetical protein [Actinomycetes bacterium]